MVRLRTLAEDVLTKHAPNRVLTLVAARVAPRPELARIPGWSFSNGNHKRSARTEFRRKLWQRFANEETAPSVPVGWLDGTRLRLHLGNDLSWCIFVGGAYEPNELFFLSTILQPGMTFVDVGANEGVYTVFAAQRVGARGQVIAIEPSSRELDRLVANLELNRLGNVAIVRAAAGDRPGATSLAIASYGHEGQNTVGTSVANAKVHTIGTEDVEMRRLDDVVADAGLDRVDFVKVDAEGSEPQIIQGAWKVLEQHRPVLQLEIEPMSLERQHSSPDEVLALLESASYATWVFDPTSGRLRLPRQGEHIAGNVIAAPKGWHPSPD